MYFYVPGHGRYVMSPSPIPRWDIHRLNQSEHLTLLETLANHTAVALKNGYLVDQLRLEAELNVYRARHDPLTDLANRAGLLERIEQTLVRRAAEAIRRAGADIIITYYARDAVRALTARG